MQTFTMPEEYLNAGCLGWDCRILLLSESNWARQYLNPNCLMADSKEPSSGFDSGSNTRKWAGYDFDTDHSIQTVDVEIKISKAGSNLDPS